MKLKTSIATCLLLFICSFSYGQMNQYNYSRELQEETEEWHKIIVPDEIFGFISPNLNDVRIIGITAKNDTIEAPYFWQIASEKKSNEIVDFKMINISRKGNGYYFTFEVPTIEAVNQISLQFKQSNFDWRITLEGSHDQQEWFKITEDYRILSIKNRLTDYQFSKVIFPDSKYLYFRLFVNSNVKPDLSSASITLREAVEFNYKDYEIKSSKREENKKHKQSVIDIDLELPVPVSYLKIEVADDFDYYRPVTLKYLSDSIKTEQGWHYNYSTLTSGTLSSLEENVFRFNSTILQKLKIIIDNHDNKPLEISSFLVKGYPHELMVRFTEPARYHFVYGSDNARKPNYDIDLFKDNIPGDLTSLSMGEARQIEKQKLIEKQPLFVSKYWLWVIMGAIILLLGWFSLKMIKER